MVSGEPAPFRGSGPFLEISPPLSLPLRHFTLASLAFLVFAGALFLGADRLVGFDFDARFALGLVHVLTLGWVAQMILGAWNQMIPVHGDVPHACVVGAKASWWAFAAGLAAFVAVLWAGSDLYWTAACLVYAGVLGELAALGLTHWRAKRRDWSGVHFAAAFVWLALLGLVGVLMAVDRHRAIIFRDPDGGVSAHVHMALVGFAGQTVFGAGYRLFPWVSMQQLRSRWEGRTAFALLNAGLVGLAFDSLFFGHRLTLLWAVLLVAAYLLYFSQMRPLLSAQVPWDASLAFVLLGMVGGAAWAGFGAGLASGWIGDETPARATYAWCALLGFFTPIILSQVHKIAPFLVWLHAYSPRQWTPPVRVPKIDDISSRGLAWGEFVALAVAVPLGAAGLYLESVPLVRAGAAALLVCASLLVLNMALLLRHLVCPDNQWTLPAQ